MPFYLFLPIFLSWLLPFSLTFLLPIDIYSTRQDAAGWLFVSAAIRNGTWLMVYWTTFALTWFVVPFLQGYVIAGQFGVLGKCWFSFKMNLLFYGLFVAAISMLILYLRTLSTITTWTGIVAILMALTNAFGLLAVMLFMGHGLVRIPRHLWGQGDAEKQLRKFYRRALGRRQDLDEAEQELASIIREIHSLSLRSSRAPDNLTPFIEELLSKTPVPCDELPTVAAVNVVLNKSYLESLNFRLPNCISRRQGAAWEWRNLLENAWYWQDVISQRETNNFDSMNINGNGAGQWMFREWSSSLEQRKSKTRAILTWWWRCRLRGYFYILISFACMALSGMVFWSEVTLAITQGNRLPFNENALLFYLALCTYTSFLKVRILSYFKLVPGQHTDDLSLLFFAAYITRLTFPLGYNYLMLVEGGLDTQFAKVMGTMNLMPLLGQSFNYYIPTILTIICFLVLFKLHNALTRFLYVEGDATCEQDVSDGIRLVQLARGEEERFMARQRLYTDNSIFCKNRGILGPSYNLGEIRKGPAVSNNENNNVWDD